MLPVLKINKICGEYVLQKTKKYNGKTYALYYRSGDHGHCKLVNLETRKGFDNEYCNKDTAKSKFESSLSSVADYVASTDDTDDLRKIKDDNSCNKLKGGNWTDGSSVINDIDE